MIRHILRWASLVALIVLYSCTQAEDIGDIPPVSEPGVYGFMSPFVEEDEPATRATVLPDNQWKYVWETGDRINIWSDSGTTLFYTVTDVSDDGTRATFNGGGFTLTNGQTYYSSHPLIHSVDDDYKHLTTTYEGQLQSGDNEAKHLAKFTYTHASATCKEGRTSFNYDALNVYFRFIITLPEALTLTELSIEANADDFFALDGSIDVTTGTFTPGKKSRMMTLKLGEGNEGFNVSDGVLNAFLAVAPCNAGEYVIRVKDSAGNVYTSPKISKPAYPAKTSAKFATEVYLGDNPMVAQIGNVKYETLEAAFAAAEDGATITLLADCAGNGIVAPQGKFTEGVTVDFGGFTYTMDGNMVGSTGTQTQAFQLLKDNKITFKNGTITSAKAKMLVQNYSNLTLEGMTLTLDNPDYTSAYTLSNNNGNVVINNTTINANPAGGFAFDVCRYSSYPSVNVTVKGESVINGNAEVSASGSDAKDGFSLMIEAGTLNGDIVIDPTAAAAMKATPEKAKVSKTTSLEIAAPDGYKWVEDSETTSTLVVCDYVSQIGENKFETLEAAFAAAKDGDVITLLADCAGNGIIAPQGKFTEGVTVDFGGFTYTMDGNMVGSTGTQTQAFQLLKDNKITFKNGTITSAKAKMLVQNYSDLTLEGMTLTLNNTGYTSAYTLSNNNGNIVIDGSTINANPAGGFAFDVCRYASYPSVNVTVKGESVINGNVEVSASGSDAKDGFSLMLESGTLSGNIVIDPTAAAAMKATPEKAKVSKTTSLEIAAPDGYKWVEDSETTSTLVACDYVSQIGENKFETLEAAFAAAEDGDVITLLADCAGNGIIAPQGKFTEGVTVDFGGYTYTMDGNMVGSTGTQTQAFQLLKDNKITFKNGTIYSEKALMLVQNYSNLTLDNMTLTLNKAGYTSAYTLSNNNGDVVINNTTINANPAGGFAFDVCRYSSYPSVNVTVKGESVINGNVEVSASGNDAKDGFSLMLETALNGEIVLDASAKAAMTATPAKAVISKKDGVEQAAPAGYGWSDNGDGTSTLSPADPVHIGSNSYATIQAAFDAAQNGDVIMVDAGTYNEVVNVTGGKTVTIQATAGADVVVAGINHSSNGTPSTVTVKSITIDNGLQTEGWFTGTSPNINPCVGAWGGYFSFDGCTFKVSGASKYETGIMTWWVTGKTTFDFDNCVFEASDAAGNKPSSARAMQIYGDVDLTVDGCTFTTAKSYSLKYVGKEGSTAVFNDNTVSNSTCFVQLGSAPYAGTGYSLSLNNTTYSGEIAPYLIDNEESQTVYIDGVKVYPAVPDYETDANGNLSIYTAAGMLYFASQVNDNNVSYSGKTITLMDNIDMTGIDWTPVGQTGGYAAKTYFQGTFDGNGKTISNLTVTHWEEGSNGGANYASGLFGFIDAAGATVKDLTMDNANVTGSHWTGAIVGYLSGGISGCTVKNSSVVCTNKNSEANGDKAGLITGYINGTQGTVTNCTGSNSTVQAYRDAGQLVGAAKSTQVSGCTATNVTVTGTGGGNIRNEVIGRLL